MLQTRPGCCLQPRRNGTLEDLIEAASPLHSDNSPEREAPRRGIWALLWGLAPLAALRGAELVGRFGCFALAAVLLPAAELATFFLALAWLALASALARMGLDRAATRHVAAALSIGDVAQARAAAGRALRISAGGGLALAALTLLAAPLAAPWLAGGYTGLAPALLACGVILPVFTMTHVVGGILVGTRRPGLGQLVQTTIWPLLLIVALLLGMRSAAGLLLLVGLTQLVTGLAGWWLLRWPPGTAQSTPRGAIATSGLLRDGVPLMALDLVGIGMVNLPLLVLGHVGSAADVAGFGLAQRLFMLPWTIIMTIAALMAPRLAAAAADRQALGQASRQAMLLSRCTALPAALLLAAAPHFWLSLFGPGFTVAAGALTVLAVAQALHAGWAVQDTVLAMAGLGDVLRRIVLLQGGLIVLGSAVLVPAWGLQGAALAVIIPLLVGAGACWLAVRRHLAAG